MNMCERASLSFIGLSMQPFKFGGRGELAFEANLPTKIEISSDVTGF